MVKTILFVLLAVIPSTGAVFATHVAPVLFAYAMLLGIENEFLSAVPYRGAVDNAWSALTTLIDAEGNVQEVCIGTGKKNDLDYYLTRPRVSGDYHGQAPVLWLATLLLP